MNYFIQSYIFVQFIKSLSQYHKSIYRNTSLPQSTSSFEERKIKQQHYNNDFNKSTQRKTTEINFYRSKLCMVASISLGKAIDIVSLNHLWRRYIQPAATLHGTSFPIQRGVEKMNTLIDIRESFFKNKVTSLMSRPLVMKILNKPMTKKSQPAVASCTSPNSIKEKIQNKQDILQTPSPKKLIDTKKQLQLKQKKQSLEMRLAYSAQQNNPDALKKLLAEHSHKQTLLTQKIQKIVDSHQQQLKKRIMARKLKSLTIKSKYTEDNSQLNENYKKQIDNQIGQIEEKSANVKIKQKINLQEKKQANELQKMRDNSQKTQNIKEKSEEVYNDKLNQRSLSQNSKKNKMLVNINEEGNKQMNQLKQTTFRKLSMDQIKNIAFKQNFIQLAIQMSKKQKDKNLKQQIRQKQQTFTNSTEQKQ